ncbi:DUF6236 family protein [Raoultella ornithinolytica]|uniref:DUF6236 family protein n=1 Tax=Raoultella ornithinolytica TaxID=54291 RepID=UPI0021A29C32|nr:DUF6236 family protein [Raoultella ornithinolytica]MCT1678515.1 DUF6236 family protein [Raoultella ornithinolytica]
MQNKIVLFPNGMITNDTIQSFSGKDPDEVTRCILYWDKIVIIDNLFISMEVLDQTLEKSLASAGIIEKHIVQMPSINGALAPALHKSYTDKIFDLLNNKDNNYATYGMENFLKGGDTSTIQNAGEIITLTNALPLPDKKTPVDKILDFREKRKGELRNLMIHMNSLEIRVASAENQDFELKKSINEIDSACATIARLFNESKIKFIPSNIDYNLNMKEIFKVASMYYAGASVVMPQTAAQIVGVTAGILSVFSVKDSIKINRIDSGNPFNYVGYLSKEFK